MKKGVLLFVSCLTIGLLTGCNGKINIKWNNYDGSTLEIDENVRKGSMPTYDGNTPVRLDDDGNYYVFKGWSPEVKTASKSVTYVAQYDSYSKVNIQEDELAYTDALPSATKDGNILHCFCWTFKQIKENLPYIAEAGFKSVQTSPVQTPKSSGSAWWAYYQPLSFSIATKSPLGTKQDLQDLCEEADNYGISVIVDIVFNHLANTKSKDYEEDGTPKVSPEVEKYEEYIYQHRNDAENPTFHHNKNATGSGSDTQYYPAGDLPDLNTGHPIVQQRALALLKECIDVGVDGFRFDAAKHIETPTDPDYPSDFWPNTLGVAKEYYKEKNNNKELYAYGEILGAPANRPISAYTAYMNVTDDYYGANLMNSVMSYSGQKMAVSALGKDTDASNIVGWLESHDTYAEESTHSKALRINQAWPILASRKNYKGLFLARPDDALSVGIVNDYQYRDETIAAANRFHNRFINGEEYLSYSVSVAINERVNGEDKGAVVVNSLGQATVQVDLPHLGTGIYYNQLTGEKVYVRDTHAIVNLDENGVAILTRTHNLPHPSLTISDRKGSFLDTKTINFSVKNATTMSYSINGGEEISFTNSKTLVLNKNQAVDDVINLTIKASNEQFQLEETFTYKVVELVPGYYNVINVNPDYFTDYDIYMWSWNKGALGYWNQNFTVQNGVILVDTTNFAGFLLALFEKDYQIPNINAWDYDGVLKQTVDISGTLLDQGYFDASDF